MPKTKIKSIGPYTKKNASNIRCRLKTYDRTSLEQLCIKLLADNLTLENIAEDLRLETKEKLEDMKLKLEDLQSDKDLLEDRLGKVTRALLHG